MSKRKALSKDLVDHPVQMYLNSLNTEASKATMRSALHSVLVLASDGDIGEMTIYDFGWPQIDAAKLEALKAALLKHHGSAHAAKCYAAVLGVLKMCAIQGMYKPEAWMQITLVKGIKVNRNQDAGRMISTDEIEELAIACSNDESAAGARDDAILGIGYSQGPRISEVLSFRLKDYHPKTGVLKIRNGKGGKARLIKASNATKVSLDYWIEQRGSKHGPLFCAINKGGRVFSDMGLSKSSLGKILAKRAEQAGIEPFTMHDLRRTYATNAWANGTPGDLIQKIMGHSSLATTAAYSRSTVEQALKSSERQHYPSQRGRG